MNSMMKNGRSFKIAPPSFNEYKEETKAAPSWTCTELAPVGLANVKAVAIAAPIIYWSDEIKEEEKEGLDADIECAVSAPMFDHEIVIYHAKSYRHSSEFLQVELNQDSIVHLDGEQIEWRNFHISLKGDVAISIMGDGIDADIVMNFDTTYINGYGSLPVQSARVVEDTEEARKEYSNWVQKPVYYTARNVGKSVPLGDELIQGLTKSIIEYEDSQWNRVCKEILGEVKTKAAEPVQLELPLQNMYIPGILNNIDIYNDGAKLSPRTDYVSVKTPTFGGFTPSVGSSLNPALVGRIGNFNTESVLAQTKSDLINAAFINNKAPTLDWSSLGANLSKQSVLSSEHELGGTTYGYAGLVPSAVA